MSEAPANLVTSETSSSPYFQASHLNNNATGSPSPAASGKLGSGPPNLASLRNKRPKQDPPSSDPRQEEFSNFAAADGARSPACHQLDAIEQRLSQQLAQLANPPDVAAIYNPTVYAGAVHREYMRRFLPPRVSVLFVGINPGKWGMCQTGVPFGWITAVRDWMQLRGDIGQPEQPTPRVPVHGFQCERNEVSGQRFWSLMRSVFGSTSASERDHSWLAEFVDAGCFVYNWCPLAFFAASGRNVTPGELKPPYRSQLEKLCNDALIDIVNLLGPGVRIVCIGGYVDRVLRSALRVRRSHEEDRSHPPRTSIDPKQMLKMIHPSPRVIGNQNWISEQSIWLSANGIGPN